MEPVRRICGLLLVVLALGALIGEGSLAQDPEIKLDLQAKSAILMEAQSGRVIFQKEPHKPLPPASITKIMTMLLVMEHVAAGKAKLEDRVVVSPEAEAMGGSQVWLETGEEMSLEDLMKSIAIVSANDSSVAVAEHIAGGEELFVDWMNKRARELGMKDTHFTNSTGLPDKEHYTSAYDIALMSRELLKYPKVHEWFTTWIDYLRDGKNILVNTNRLIKFYKGADGLKTGYTDEAGYCLAATAERDGVRFIAVVMGEPDSQTRFNEAAKLLDIGFRHYVGVELARKDQPLTEVEVLRGATERVSGIARDRLVAVVRRGEESKVTTEVRLLPRIVAPISKGDKLGELVALKDGEELARTEVVAAQDVKRGNIFVVILRILRKLFASLFRFSSK